MNELKRLRQSLERIKRVLLIKLESTDDLLVFEQLDWLEERIKDLFKLKDIDFLRFHDLINPDFKYSVQLASKGLSPREKRILTKAWQESRSTNKEKKRPWFYSRSNYWYTEEDLFDTLLKMLFQIMKKAEDMRNYNVFHRSRFIIYFLYENVCLIDDSRISFNSIYAHFTPRLNQIVRSEQADITVQKNGHLFLAFYIHLDHLQLEGLPVLSIEITLDSMYWAARIYLENNNDHAIESLVSTLNGRSLNPSWPSRSGVVNELARHEVEQNWLNIIDEKLYDTASFLFTSDQYNYQVKQIQDLENRVAREVADLKVALTSLLEEFQEYILKKFKFRLAQLMQIRVLVFCNLSKKV